VGSAHVPVRTCVGCRGRAPKRELLRLVVDPDGAIRVDPSGRAQGRGAYVHRDAGCAEAALRRGALARALRAGAPAQGAATLRTQIEGALNA
jgi:hypothetical protein